SFLSSEFQFGGSNSKYHRGSNSKYPVFDSPDSYDESDSGSVVGDPPPDPPPSGDDDDDDDSSDLPADDGSSGSMSPAQAMAMAALQRATYGGDFGDPSDSVSPAQGIAMAALRRATYGGDFA